MGAREREGIREDIKIAHALPGRIRLKVARLKANPDLAKELQERLSTIQGLHRAEVNPVTGSVLVFYETERMLSPDSLSSLSEQLAFLLPGIDFQEMATAWLAQSQNGSGSSPSLAHDISKSLGSLNAGIGKVTGGIDLRVLVPLTLFFFGLRGLLVSKPLPSPTWYDFLWFALGTFVMLNPGTGQDRR